MYDTNLYPSKTYWYTSKTSNVVTTMKLQLKREIRRMGAQQMVLFMRIEPLSGWLPQDEMILPLAMTD